MRWLVALVVLAVGCGAPERAPAADAGTDAGIDVADHCAWQAATVEDFVRNGWCAATWASASGVHACSACGAWLVAGTPGPYVLRDCFYDAQSGALVGGWLWQDDGPCIVAGVGHDTCRDVAYPPACPDGGAP